LSPSAAGAPTACPSHPTDARGPPGLERPPIPCTEPFSPTTEPPGRRSLTPPSGSNETATGPIPTLPPRQLTGRSEGPRAAPPESSVGLACESAHILPDMPGLWSNITYKGENLVLV